MNDGMLTRRDATDGFNACALCGFENFMRDQFCRLCATTIAANRRSRDSTLVAPALSGLSTSFVGELTDVRRYLGMTGATEDDTHALLSKRQQRVRCV